MKNIISIIAYVLSIGILNAQIECDGSRYYVESFPLLSVTSDVEFGENDQPTLFNPNARQTLYMDIYEPAGDMVTQRPLIMLAFGGAFVAGSKTDAYMVDLCERFAKLGYVTASIDYRLTPELFLGATNEEAYLAVMKATHDMKAAIRFFRKNVAEDGNTFGISADHIFVGGVSAGGFAALHCGYLDNDSEVPVEIQDDLPALGGLEGVSGNSGYSSEVAGVINLCGALGDKSWMETGGVPIVSVHGTEDEIVPYGDDNITLFGLSLPVSGSSTLHQKANELGIYNNFHSFAGSGHTPFIGSEEYMDTTFGVVKNFVFQLICGPNSTEEIENMMGYNLYPNPFSENTTIETDEKVSAVKFYDILGNTVEFEVEFNVNQIVISRSDQRSGTYQFSLFNASDTPIGNGKFILK